VQENFFNVRVNAGNILWLSRSESAFEELNIRETDVLFNPLALYEAQPITDKKNYKEDNLIELVSEKETVLHQYQNLNGIIENNNKFTHGKRSYAFIVTPNMTIMGYNLSTEIVSILGGKTFVKNRSPLSFGYKKSGNDLKEEDAFLQMRGFENKELTKIESDKWFEVDEKGRSITNALENINWLTMGEFITKRIPSLLVARELLFTEYSKFAFQEKYDPALLAQNDGYRLWGALKTADGEKKADLELRLEFLKEYFRRVETTNLLVSSHFSERLKERGESLKSMEYGNYFFIKALNRYYSYDDINLGTETGEVLNSTNKILWKRMHGIR
jgi:hypothetical protein